MPFGSSLFLPTPVPQARIPSADVLAVFPTADKISAESHAVGGMLEISPKAYEEFIELSSRMQKKYERLFDAWSRKTGH